MAAAVLFVLHERPMMSGSSLARGRWIVANDNAKIGVKAIL